MEEEKRRKKSDPKQKSAIVENEIDAAEPWIRKNIVVKIVAKSLGDKYYKKKGHVKEVIDEYVGLVVANDSGAKLKVDQEHLETVIPQVGREVVILAGKHKGATAILKSIDTDKFSAVVKLESGDKVSLPYEHFSKKYIPP